MQAQELGGYRLEQQLPLSGASTRLFVASDTDGAPTYITKLLMPRGTGEWDALRERFRHEGHMLAACSHASIPSWHASGEHDGLHYIVMERIEGVDLGTLLGHRAGTPRALTPAMAVYILGQIADALSHLHELKIEGPDGQPMSLDAVHRDVCPDNIMISRFGDASLVDFGSARSLWLAPGYDYAQIGRKAYMAPERAHGSSPANVRTDLFALAAVGWEMLRGERLFEGDNELQTMDNIARFDLSHSNRRITGISSTLSEVIRYNLDRDPARRHESAARALQRLSRCDEAEHVGAARHELAAMVETALSTSAK